MPPVRPNGSQQVIQTFGDPRPFVNDKAQWEQQALQTQPLPRPLIYAYDTTQKITRVRAHRLLTEHLVATLEECLSRGVPLQRIKYGGCYQWRAKRTAAGELSLHTWGIAVDVEPAENPLGEPWVDNGVRLDPRIIHAFKDLGWFWGGDFQHTKDPQHFQWATGV
jgi:D-alanyl-D-alanine carboxypeptidase